MYNVSVICGISAVLQLWMLVFLQLYRCIARRKLMNSGAWKITGLSSFQ